MGRSPCCDKIGIKKGPWTPEEDIILVSYIQEHGPGNWRSVPTNTGLLRCSKSCRLRWTNYLKPGIKRGNFTPHEEGMIIHLQALLGNKWAAIASYLPQRTDNDIKNYWNTHLKKKLKKFQTDFDPRITRESMTNHQLVSKSNFNNIGRRSLEYFTDSTGQDPSLLRFNGQTSTTTTATYASSTENISRLLEGWMRSSSSTRTNNNNSLLINSIDHHNSNNETSTNIVGKENSSATATSTLFQCYWKKVEEQESGGDHDHDLISHKEFESILSFDHHQNMNNNSSNVASWDNNKSTGDSTTKGTSGQNSSPNIHDHDHQKVHINATVSTTPERKPKSDHQNSSTTTSPPLSFLEKWLLDETNGQVDQEMNQMMEVELSPIF